MKYPEEDLATDLHAELLRQFGSTPTSISVDGSGVHWHCTADRGNSTCSIACFAKLGPEYYTNFKRNSEQVATARIPSRVQTIEAITDWLNGCELSELYDKHSFVDKTKRTLTRIRDDVLLAEPGLKFAAHDELDHDIADIYYLRFAANNRSCQMSFYGKNELPDAKFSWDDCQLFQFQPDQVSRLATVLKRWLSDQSSPSQMRKEFPWLEIGELADYYENGNPIEGEFIRSWESIEDFYRQDWFRFSGAVLVMIQAMRSAGYDRVLRAGQSMSSLGLSRSRRHGLRTEQASLWFEFRNDEMDVHLGFAWDGLKGHPIKFTQDVQRMMDALVDVEID